MALFLFPFLTFSCYCTRESFIRSCIFCARIGLEREKGLAPSSDEPSKKFPVISHASVNFKLREKKVDSQASPERCGTALRVPVFVCSPVFSPPSSPLLPSPSPPSSPPFFQSHLLSPSLLFSVWITQSLSFNSPLHLSLQ